MIKLLFCLSIPRYRHLFNQSSIPLRYLISFIIITTRWKIVSRFLSWQLQEIETPRVESYYWVGTRPLLNQGSSVTSCPSQSSSSLTKNDPREREPEAIPGSFPFAPCKVVSFPKGVGSLLECVLRHSCPFAPSGTGSVAERSIHAAEVNNPRQKSLLIMESPRTTSTTTTERKREREPQVSLKCDLPPGTNYE